MELLQIHYIACNDNVRERTIKKRGETNEITITQNSPYLVSKSKLQIQEARKTPVPKIYCPDISTFKYQKGKGRETILKDGRVEAPYYTQRNKSKKK